MQLVVQLWQGVLLVDGGLRQVSHGSSLNHVSDGDSLDGLVLWHTSSTVQTSDWLDVTSALLVSTVGSSLLWHLGLLVMCLKIWIPKGKGKKKKHFDANSGHLYIGVEHD